MLKPIARFFRGVNIAIGVTTIAEEAPPQVERKFVAVWLGISVFFLFWLLFLFLWITS
ncbi:MAG TPA: hypothetical protein VGM92_11765 [Candidatus Kapabacteria bacterium]|jgi:hypothetical protein